MSGCSASGGWSGARRRGRAGRQQQHEDATAAGESVGSDHAQLRSKHAASRGRRRRRRQGYGRRSGRHGIAAREMGVAQDRVVATQEPRHAQLSVPSRNCPPDPRLDRALRRLVLIGAGLVLAVPAARGHEPLVWRLAAVAAGDAAGQLVGAASFPPAAAPPGGTALAATPPQRGAGPAAAGGARPPGAVAARGIGRRPCRRASVCGPSASRDASHAHRSARLRPTRPRWPLGLMAGPAPRRRPRISPRTPCRHRPNDPYAWLEDVTGAKPLGLGARSRTRAPMPSSPPRRNSRDAKPASARSWIRTRRSPKSRRSAPYYYNFWKDAQHERGLWRRTTLDEYRKPASAVGNRDRPGRARCGRRREVGLARRRLPQAGVRALPGRAVARRQRCRRHPRIRPVHEAMGARTASSARKRRARSAGSTATRCSCSTDFGAGLAMTTSGYPRIAKLWHRGTPLRIGDRWSTRASRRTSRSPRSTTHTPGFERDFVSRALDFYSDELYLRGQRRRTGEDRRARFGDQVRAPRMAAAAAARPVDGRRGHVRRRIAAGRALRRLHGRQARVRRAVRADRIDVARQLHLDAAPPGAQRARRRQEPPVGADAGCAAAGRAARSPGAPTFGTLGVRAVDDDESDAVWLTATDLPDAEHAGAGRTRRAAPKS